MHSRRSYSDLEMKKRRRKTARRCLEGGMGVVLRISGGEARGGDKWRMSVLMSITCDEPDSRLFYGFKYGDRCPPRTGQIFLEIWTLFENCDTSNSQLCSMATDVAGESTLTSTFPASYSLVSFPMLMPGHSRNSSPSISSVFISNATSVPLAVPSSNPEA